MGANLTIYCLEQVTDYFGFERLSHDLMALEGYSSIEPLGGFSDKGRDAIQVDKSGEVTIFAYSVREDWRAKLAEDASKIVKHGHRCKDLVFITTADITASERDQAVLQIKNDFGWKLDLFGLERLRILLEVTHPELRKQHPQIFPPEFIKLQELGKDDRGRNHILIIYDPKDRVLAEWMTRKLTSAGYLVWCESFKLLGGDKFPDDVYDAIENRAFRVLSLYSNQSLNNPELIRQRVLASRVSKDLAPDFLIPIDVDGISPAQLDHPSQNLTFIPFQNSWAKGLQQLLDKLADIDCPKDLPEGPGVAASSFFEREYLSDEPEYVYSNCLLAERIPPLIHRFEVDLKIPNHVFYSLKSQWAFRSIKPQLYASFHHPPDWVVNEFQANLIDSVEWDKQDKVDGILCLDIVSELLKKSLGVKCIERGLVFEPAKRMYYFPNGLIKSNRLRFIRPDGKQTHISVVGERKFWQPRKSYQYIYYLGPEFTIRRDFYDDFVAIVQIGTRFSAPDGTLLPKKSEQSRRKHLTRDWWNKQWFYRMLAITQFLGDKGKITIGNQENEQVIFHSEPIKLSAPYGINSEPQNQSADEE